MNTKPTVSPTRRYVAVCNKMNWDGHYFRSFALPEKDPRNGDKLLNDSDHASWFFLNRLDAFACIDGCVTEESFKDVREVTL
jgi:hypothetical protein